MTVLHTAISYLAPMAASPSPGGYNGPAIGTGSPPGAQKFSTVLGWASWVVSGMCVLGILIVGGTMAVASRRGGAGEHASALGWILAACAIIGSATTIVGIMMS
ncbi:MAG: hypothetical protein QOH50_3001 [Kribbellaceae bacterium]|jgi:hypothetical protein|nr:hypothetical protein [Kribbellaceae bacterium]